MKIYSETLIFPSDFTNHRNRSLCSVQHWLGVHYPANTENWLS